MGMALMADTCRVCLCGGRRLHAISNSLFQETWEKLTNAKFNTSDGKSLLVCYICCAQLRRSHQLMLRALEAEKLLTAIINNDSEQSQNALLLIARQTFGFDYKYVIEHQYPLDGKQFVRNSVDEIKKENEGESEEDNKEWRVINIKEEIEDSSQEHNLDNAHVESGTPSDDDTPLKQIVESEGQIVLERTNIGSLTRKYTLRDANQNAKRIKLNETSTSKDRSPLTNTVLESFPRNHTEVSHTKNLSVDLNMKLPKNKKIIKSVDNCHQINNISANVITQNNETITSKLVCNNVENETFKQCLTKSVDAVAPRITGSDEGKKSSICNVRKGSLKRFSCHMCQFKCISKSDLNRHLRKHTGEKPYECDLCDYRDSRRGNLKRHMKYKHTKEKNFSCHMCQYKFVTKDELNRHLRKHTGEKPYKCDLCEYRCSQSCNIYKHIKYKHTKEKNFSCHMCQYKCITKSKLSAHFRKHTGEKPYKCDMCDYKSSCKSTLNRHIILKHAK